jgi:hypothetical protein
VERRGEVERRGGGGLGGEEKGVAFAVLLAGAEDWKDALDC